MWGYNYYVYIMTNDRRTVLYTGMTNDLRKRTLQHKEKCYKGFTSRYNVDRLVYLERYSSAQEAVAREKQIKAGSRAKKLTLISDFNPEWKDLYYSVEIG